MAARRFTAVLEESDRGGGGHWVVVPLDVREIWGLARAPVAGTVNGVPIRSRLMVYGGRTVLGLTKAIRAEAGIAVGDRVDVEIDLDTAPREVEVPPALKAALAGDEVARTAFDALSFTHRREYARWIAEAKREDTRERRTAKALEMLRAGVETPD